MPSRMWLMPQDIDKIEPADEKIGVVGDTIRLRRVDSDGNYDVEGKYYQSEAVLPNHRANSIKELFGFMIECEENDGGIGWRLSSDNGVTWYGWDGVSWVAGGPFVDWEEVDRHIGVFELEYPKQARLQVRLSPSANNRRTPVVQSIALFLEYEYDFLEDFFRSIKHFVEEHVRAVLVCKQELSGALTIDIPPSEHTAEQILAPIEAYNLTVDPGRLTDLFVSLAGRTVTLSALQTGVVEVRYRSVFPVHIATDVDYQLADMPAIILTVSSVDDVPKLRPGGGTWDYEWSKKQVRWRQLPVKFDCSVVLACMSELKTEALATADAIGRVLGSEQEIVSDAIGERFQVLGFGPVSAADSVSEGVYVEEVPVTIGGSAWVGTVKEIELVQQIRIALVGAARPDIVMSGEMEKGVCYSQSRPAYVEEVVIES